MELEVVIKILWDCNIPIMYCDSFPSSYARPAGFVIREGENYAIMLSHKHKSKATQLFVVLHEIGHILNKHLAVKDSLVDINISVLAETLKPETIQDEIEADEFAFNSLRKGHDLKKIISGFGELEIASSLYLKSKRESEEFEINQAHIILSYGYETKNWALMNDALKFLDDLGAQEIIKKASTEYLASYHCKSDDLDLIEKI